MHRFDTASDTASQVIRNFCAGTRSAADLLATIRRAVLFLPISDADEVFVGDARGLGWVYAFTSLPELARFARARNAGDQSWPYVSMRGAMVLDHVLASAPRPCGVAIDVAGAHPMLLPPIVGVVADAAAVSLPADRVRSARADTRGAG